MNDETREDEVIENLVDDVAADMVGALQDDVDSLQEALTTALGRVTELETTVEPAGDESLRALAATVRQCQRNGHPDLGAHLDTLLTALGAV